MAESIPPELKLTQAERSILEQIVRRHTSPQRLVTRARIILQLSSGANNKQTSRTLCLNRGTVQYWRRRWLALSPKLQQAQQPDLDDKTLRQLIEQGLSDEPRKGAPPKFTPEQIVQIVALACQDPAESNRPISHWSERELADEAQKRQIVETISTRSVGRFLKSIGFETAQSGAMVERQD